MELRDQFYREFLRELSAVDDYLGQRAGERGSAHGPIDAADPDVRRLLEAMSFFAARTRQLTVERFDQSVHRLARGHLDELLVPQPMRCLMQATPNARLVEPTYLPRGADVRVTSADNAVGRFTTMHGLMLWPISVVSANLGLRAGSGYRLLIELKAQVPLRTLDAPLRFHIDYLRDYPLSSLFGFALRKHVERAFVSYDEAPGREDAGASCELTFGAPAPLAAEAHAHPISDIRTFFHFPQLENFFEVTLAGDGRPWRRAWIGFDLDDGWPTDITVNRDVFHLFVVPIENLRRDSAEPILYDGTQSQIPLRAPATHPDDELRSVAAVYEEDPGGLQPIPPAHLAIGSEAYEVETFGSTPETAEHYLKLQLPGAFENPRKVVVDAAWHQPWFERHAVGQLGVSLQTRRIEGVRWGLRGAMMSPTVSELWGQPFAQLELLSLKSKPVLTRNELIYLMRVLGAADHAAFRGIDDLIAEVRVSEEPTEGAGATIGYVYELSLKSFDEGRRAAVFHYLSRMWALLESWSPTPARLQVSSDVSAREPLLMRKP
ncbi:MAG: hypothetical protein Tsb0020_00550 [Haliangiales bacterium]